MLMKLTEIEINREIFKNYETKAINKELHDYI